MYKYFIFSMGCLYSVFFSTHHLNCLMSTLLVSLLLLLLVSYPRHYYQNGFIDSVLCVFSVWQQIDMGRFDLIGLEGRVSRYEADTFLPRHRLSRRILLEIATAPDPPPRPKPVKMKVNRYMH